MVQLSVEIRRPGDGQARKPKRRLTTGCSDCSSAQVSG
jgi:hypothetical protein